MDLGKPLPAQGNESTKQFSADGRVLVQYLGKMIPYPPTPEETASQIQERDKNTKNEVIKRQIREAQEYHDQKLRDAAQRDQGQLKTASIDLASGEEFEQYLEEIFTDMGYQVCKTSNTMSPDYGVDLILTDRQNQPSLMIAVQAKRYSNTVGVEAVQQVFAGKRHYRCKLGVVVTNSQFSSPAIKLAKSTGVILVDGTKLKKLVSSKEQRPFG